MKTNLDTFRTVLGLRATFTPLPVEGAKVYRYKNIQEYLDGRGDISVSKGFPKTKNAFTNNATIRLMAFDDDRFGAASRIPRKWNLFLEQEGNSAHSLNATQVGSAGADANVCFRIDRNDNNVRCLPSFIIVGFEKASTTALSVWLSHHPNLQSQWLEGRFFDHITSSEELDQTWFEQYALKRMPRLPGGTKGVGLYFTFEKSPAYAPSVLAPEMISRLLPSAKLIFMLRNPTMRAYSFFLMLTNHYPGAKEVLSRKPKSFFVKSRTTGQVRYVGDGTMNFDIGPGEGGQAVPMERMPSGSSVEGEESSAEWHFLPYPPDPKDFHSWILYMLDQFKGEKPNFNDQSRPHRLLFGGFYSSYLKRYLEYFQPQQLVLIPSESFYGSNVSRSMTKLQDTLGLPIYDFSRIGRQESSGRFNIKSPAAYTNDILKSARTVAPMLEETKVLLDDFYCQENRELKRILGGRSLSGYACAG